MTCSALPIFKEEGYPCSLPKATRLLQSTGQQQQCCCGLTEPEDFRKDSFPYHWAPLNRWGWSLEAPNGSNGEPGWWMQREGGECLQGTEEQRKGVNAINPGCNWKEGMEGKTSSCRCQDGGSHHKILAPSGLSPFRLFASWGFIVQYNSFAGWNHAFPHGPSGLQEGK